MTGSRPPPPECANCGATIPPRAKVCPDCGADERTGWREVSIYDDLDLPEDAFEEGGGSQKSSRRARTGGVSWYWWCVVVVLIVLLALGALMHW